MRLGFPVGSDGKESACIAEDPGSIPGSGRSPGQGNGCTPIFLPGDAPWGHEESDMTERLSIAQHISV